MAERVRMLPFYPVSSPAFVEEGEPAKRGGLSMTGVAPIPLHGPARRRMRAFNPHMDPGRSFTASALAQKYPKTASAAGLQNYQPAHGQDRARERSFRGQAIRLTSVIRF
jgi:hypothetical protein